MALYALKYFHKDMSAPTIIEKATVIELNVLCITELKKSKY